MKSKDYQKILRSLIKKSFPELKKSWIIISSPRLMNVNYSATAVEFFIFKWIIIWEKGRKYPKDALTGMLAHELSHFVIIKHMNFFKKIFYFWNIFFSKKKRADNERRTDLEVVKRGFGKQRIELNRHKFRGKTKEQIEESYKKGYLSTKEIKQYMKKLK